MTKVSYCISTHNNLNYLKLCIDSIYKNTYYKEYEILVYAEGCDDGTNEWLREKEQTEFFKYWIHPEKWDLKYWGIGGGINFLAKKSKSKYLIFLHSDMYIGPDFDQYLIDNVKDGLIISSHRIEPDVFNQVNWEEQIYGVYNLRPGTLVSEKKIFGHLYSNFNNNLFDNFASGFIQSNNFEVRKGEGAGGFIITKNDWNLIGENDPLFAPASWEDMDFLIRAQLKGIEFTLTSKSMIWHFGARSSHFPSDDFSKSSEKQIKYEQENKKKWLTKWNKFPIFDSIGFVSSNGMQIINKNNQYR